MNSKTRRKTGRVQTGRGAFTLIELLAVISIIAVLAGMLVGLAPSAGAKMRESRVRAELAQLVAAIEEYKARYGFYPPDGLHTEDDLGRGVRRGTPRPELNPLYYELVGMQVIKPRDPSGYFQSLDGDETLNSAQVQTYFGRDGIANASPERRRILTQNIRASQKRELFPRGTSQPDIDILVIPVPWPKDRPPVINLPNVAPGLNPWRYVSTNPTNNPTSFDLWAEFYRGTNKVVIGNWRQ